MTRDVKHLFSGAACHESKTVLLTRQNMHDKPRRIGAVTGNTSCDVFRRFRLRTPSSAVPDAIAQAAGYAVSQQKRKLIEQGFGWAKTVEPIRQVMVRGLKKVDQLFVLTMAAYNLTRMRTLEQIRLQTT